MAAHDYAEPDEPGEAIPLVDFLALLADWRRRVEESAAAATSPLPETYRRNPITSPPEGRPLRLDPAARSTVLGVPAFVGRPEGAPVYHGFPVLPVEVEGFRLGMITDFLVAPDTAGDGFVVAPDGSRAGLVWEAEVAEFYLQEVLPTDRARWGVWAVGVPLPLRTLEDAQAFLAALLPALRPRWEEWEARP